MEDIEARALKPSLRHQISVKSTQQVFDFEHDGRCVGLAASREESFSVDDLLDLSDEKIDGVSVQEEEAEAEAGAGDEKGSQSASSRTLVDDDNSLTSTVAEFEVDEWEDLEWVSRFVEDQDTTASVPSLLCPAGYSKAKTGAAVEYQSVEPASRGPPRLRFPARARSKRPRLRRSSGFLPLSTTLSSSSTSASAEMGPRSPRKGRGKNIPAPPRRCCHCQVQKTPQWRSGPLGAKTLCNACGVRFNSGRLFPEYRPADSPTFSADAHSNSHREVLEMRRKKQMWKAGGSDSDSGPRKTIP